MGINVLSLFDGLSGGQLALRGLGISPTRYYASEIDPFAVEVTQTNFPNTVQLGDVVKLRRYLCATPGNREKMKALWYCTAKTRRLIEQMGEILSGGIDLVIGGSPCQGFSFAGKGLNFNDPRSRLFFEFVHILNAIKRTNPNVVFLLENVVMKREHQMVISNYLGVEPIRINSALVVAQNRDRLYWTNILARPVNLFGDLRSEIPQPKDRGVLLADILEEDVPEKYFVTDAVLPRIARRSGNFSEPKVSPGKTGRLTAKNNSGQMSLDSGTTLIVQKPRGKNAGGEKALDGKTPAVSSSGWQSNNHLAAKSNTVTPDGYLQRGERDRDSEGNAVETSVCNRRLRRLTIGEVCALQGVPKAYFFSPTPGKYTPGDSKRNPDPELGCQIVSSTQIYKMLGNGWTIQVIEHILSFAPFAQHDKRTEKEVGTTAVLV
jgi:site-specific DNA-cytosine methylase